MTLLAFDTATAATVAGLLTPGRDAPLEARDDPPPGARPRHTAQLLTLVEQVLSSAGRELRDVERIAVGVGPGSFTGLRIGVATARALALATGAEVVPVPTLRALALQAEEHVGAGSVVMPVLDARRGEVFAAAWRSGRAVLTVRAEPPERLAEIAFEGGVGDRRALVAVGDGAIRFREHLERAGVSVPADGSALHRVGAAALVRLGADGVPVDRAALLPEYLRLPDAEIALRARTGAT